MLGTDHVNRAGGLSRSPALARSSPLPWLLRSATGGRSARGAVWLLGSAWCPRSTRPAARSGSAASPSKAIAICDGSSSPAPWLSFATRERTAPNEEPSQIAIALLGDAAEPLL